jgi:hypothetical protein
MYLIDGRHCFQGFIRTGKIIHKIQLFYVILVCLILCFLSLFFAKINNALNFLFSHISDF